jgi:hypothetical protein
VFLLATPPTRRAFMTTFCSHFPSSVWATLLRFSLVAHPRPDTPLGSRPFTMNDNTRSVTETRLSAPFHVYISRHEILQEDNRTAILSASGAGALHPAPCKWPSPNRRHRWAATGVSISSASRE